LASHTDHDDHAHGAHAPVAPEDPVARFAGYGMLAGILAILLATIVVPVTGARPMIVTTAIVAVAAIAFGLLGAVTGAGMARRRGLLLATVACAVVSLVASGLAWQETGRGCGKGQHRAGMICKND
jgi:hypothetical protein